MTVFAVEYRYATGVPDRLDEVRPAHRAWLRERAEEGLLLASGPYEGGASALLIFRAEDRAALDALLAKDPFAQAGLIAETGATVWNPIIGLLAEAAAA
ncbi:YciI family protein [Sinomonas mesophila]|uniref:YciI family protein n=1 Tax=Sinomonas mesophila TaxID=1531955 RepID=UPI0009870ABB|nr:YciI family protein [Sinomonas mesophila]